MTNPTEEQDEFIPTRHSLLTRLKNHNDHEGWQVFFDTYWRLIYSVAQKSGLRDDEAEEVVQETVISVSKAMPGFHYDPARGSFKSWLMQVVRCRVADQFRKRPRLATESFRRDDSSATETATIERVPDSTADALEIVWDAEWKNNLLMAALDRVKVRVKPLHFQIFVLSVRKEWPVRKVARTLGVSVAQVYLVKHRVSGIVRRAMQKLLQETS